MRRDHHCSYVASSRAPESQTGCYFCHQGLTVKYWVATSPEEVVGTRTSSARNSCLHPDYCYSSVSSGKMRLVSQGPPGTLPFPQVPIAHQCKSGWTAKQNQLFPDRRSRTKCFLLFKLSSKNKKYIYTHTHTCNALILLQECKRKKILSTFKPSSYRVQEKKG